MSVDVVTALEVQAWPDEAIVARVVAGEAALFGVLMRRHNQRIYRIVRSILDDHGEAEDVMQDAYVGAYVGQTHDFIPLLAWHVNEMTTVRYQGSQIAEGVERGLLENSLAGDCAPNHVKSRFVLSGLPCRIDSGAQPLRCLLPMLMISSYVVS